MSRKIRILSFIFLVLTIGFFLVGCGGIVGIPDIIQNIIPNDDPSDSNDNHDPNQKRTSIVNYMLPQASGDVTYGDDTVSIDASNTDEGYVMVRYTGDADMAKVQITGPEQNTYTYTITTPSYVTFSLTEGDGNYNIEVLEHAYDNMYALLLSQDIDVELNDDFRPFLYPNQYAWYTADSDAVEYALSVSEGSSNDLDFVEQVYDYIIENISYDEQLAQNLSANYIPDVDNTLRSGKGICFDYASLMTAMLRSQGIPVKLQVGYSGEAYHAWISVYLKEIGWVDDIIEFDGNEWVLMDPTLGANNNQDSVAQYIGDGNNYTVKYSY